MGVTCVPTDLRGDPHEGETDPFDRGLQHTPAERARAAAAAGRDAVRGRQRRADLAAAARPLHPAAGARVVTRGLRGAARSAPVPPPAAIPQNTPLAARGDTA